MKNTKQNIGTKCNPLAYQFCTLWKYSEGNHRNVRLYWIMFIVANSIALIWQPLLMANLMDTLQKEGVTRGNFNHIVWVLIQTLLVTIMFWALHGPARVIEEANAYKAQANYGKFMLRGVLNLPLIWHSNHHSGDTNDKIQKGRGALRSFSSNSFQIISIVVQLLVCYFMLVYVSWPAAIIVSVFVAIAVIVISKLDKIILRDYSKLNEMENDTAKHIQDGVSNVMTVLTLRIEQFIFDSVSRRIDAPYELTCKNNIRNEWKWFFTNFLSTCMTVTVLFAYCAQQIHVETKILASGVFLLIKYLDQLEMLFFRFTDLYGETLRHYAKLMNSQELVKDFRSVSMIDHRLPINWKTITVNGLCFSYHSPEERNGKDMHIDNVNFEIRQGEMLAIVGGSGGGKTTTLKAIIGLLEPCTIKVSIDGQKIDGGFYGISRAIMMIPQKSDMFARSIRENITLGTICSDDVVMKYIRLVGFDDDLLKLQAGLDTLVGEKGVKLSGGQLQRLALARGLLAYFEAQDSSILLMDEATASIDSVKEAEIYRRLKKAFLNRTVISSVHGLHLLKYYDRILVFDEGKIVDTGSFEDLLARCPRFQEMWARYDERKEKARSTEDE